MMCDAAITIIIFCFREKVNNDLLAESKLATKGTRTERTRVIKYYYLCFRRDPHRHISTKKNKKIHHQKISQSWAFTTVRLIKKKTVDSERNLSTVTVRSDCEAQVWHVVLYLLQWMLMLVEHTAALNTVRAQSSCDEDKTSSDSKVTVGRPPQLTAPLTVPPPRLIAGFAPDGRHRFV